MNDYVSGGSRGHKGQATIFKNGLKISKYFSAVYADIKSSDLIVKKAFLDEDSFLSYF